MPPLHASQALLDADDLTVRFGEVTPVDSVSFCIHKGDFIGLIGPNGAGKTTLLKVVLGLLDPSSGTVHRSARSMGYVPQRGALYDGVVPLSVLEVVRLGSDAKDAAYAALEMVGLQNISGKRFSELSGGQQQRVIIAKALAAGTELLILDEPSTGIDDASQRAFYQLLRELAGRGITIVMVSHEVEMVLSMVTRVICLNQTVLYDGPPEHFAADTYLPQAFSAEHRKLHHQHAGTHHA